MMTYQVCNKCLMDTTDPEITFNDDGICIYCQTYEQRNQTYVPKSVDKEKYLNAMVDYCKDKGKGKKYDCVLSIRDLKNMITQIKRVRKGNMNGEATTGVFQMDIDKKEKMTHYLGEIRGEV